MRAEPPNPRPVEVEEGKMGQRTTPTEGPPWGPVAWMLWAAAVFGAAGLVGVSFRYAVRAWTGGS